MAINDSDTLTSFSGNGFIVGAFGNDQFLNSLLRLPRLSLDESPKTLTVTGQGEESIPTTLTQINLGVEIQGETAAEVQQQVARRSAALVELLQLRNVEQLETTSISLQPTYSYEDNVQRSTGFEGTNIVSFRVDTQEAGPLLDEAVEAGATRIDNISFVASDEAIAAAEEQALREATEDGLRLASTVFDELNLTPQEITSIQINGANPPQPLLLSEAFDLSKAASVITPVIPGEQQVGASVTLQIGY